MTEDKKQWGIADIELILTQYPVDAIFPIGHRIGDRGPMWKTFHKGLDFKSKRDEHGNIIESIENKPVYAVMDGKVAIAGMHMLEDNEGGHPHPGPFGNRIWHMSRDPGIGLLRFGYCHLSEMLVAVGEEVKRGQIIGKVGKTGNVDAAHLHFQPELFPGREIIPVRWA